MMKINIDIDESSDDLQFLIVISDHLYINLEDSYITIDIIILLRARRFSHICCEDSPQALHIR